MITLGARIKEARTLKGITQAELGKLLGTSDATINRYEKDIRKPDPDTLSKLSKLLNVSTDWLLGGKEYRKLDMSEIFQDSSIKITASGKPLTKEQRLNILRALNAVTTAKSHIPLLGEIKPDALLISESNIIGQVEIPADLEGKVDFALYVRGNAMIGAGINEKDIVLCKQQENASSGQIVAALIKGTETTLRYFIPEDEKNVLKSANPEYKDIELQPGDQLLGYVVKILKDPPPISTYREYIFLKEELLQEWNNVIEKALSFGIKPSAVGEFVGTQVEIAKKLKGK